MENLPTSSSSHIRVRGTGDVFLHLASGSLTFATVAQLKPSEQNKHKPTEQTDTNFSLNKPMCSKEKVVSNQDI